MKNRTVVLLLPLLAFVAFHCVENPTEVILPASEISLNNLSLVHVTKSVGDILRPDSSLHRNSDGTYSYSAEQNLEPVGSMSIPAIQPVSQREDIEIGRFTVDSIQSVSYALAVRDFGLTPGTYPFFVRTPMHLPSGTVTVSSQIRYAVISSGSLTLTVKNTMPMTLEFNSPLVIRNNQDGDNSVIAQFTLPPVGPQTAVTQTVPLTDKTVRAAAEIDNFDCTFDDSASPVTIGDADGIEFQFSSTGLVVDSAVAVIPEQPAACVYRSQYVLDPVTTIREASCKEGNVDLVVTNRTNVSVATEWTINELVNTATGERYECTQLIPAQDSITLPIALKDWKIVTPAGTVGTTVTFSVNSRTMGSGGSVVCLTRSDHIIVEMRTRGKISLRDIRGNFPPVPVAVNSAVAANLNLNDVEKFIGAVRLQGIGMQLHLRGAALQGPLDYHLALIAKSSKTGSRDSLVFGTDAGMPRVRFDPSVDNDNVTIDCSAIPGLDAFVSGFFPAAPDSFIVRGTVILNPADEYANPSADCRITDTSTVSPSMTLVFPGAAGISAGSYSGTYALDGGVSLPSEMKSGTLTVTLANRIPLQMNFGLYFLGANASRTSVDTLVIVEPAGALLAAQTDANGFAAVPAVSRLSVTLNAVQLAALARTDSVMLKLWNAGSPAGAVVHLQAADYLDVSVVGSFQYAVNEK